MDKVALDNALKKQELLQTRIVRIITNMRKKGVETINKNTIQSRLSLLESYWKEYSENDSDLNIQCSDEQLTAEYFNEHYDHTEEAYVTTKAELNSYFDKESVKTSATDRESTESTRKSLPRISIEPFDGDLLKWTAYRDIFQSLIINNHSLSNVERLHYLKTTLTNEPAALIASIPITDKDFQRAWKALLDEYDNRQVLINAYIGSLMSLPSMTKACSAQLRSLLHKTVNAVDALRAMDRPVDSWCDWLNYITIRRLDGETRRSWEMSREEEADLPTFKQLRSFLTARLRSLTTSSMPGFDCSSTSASASKAQLDGSSSSHRRSPTTASGRPRVHTVTGEAGAGKRCLLCDKSHFLLFCDKYNKMKPRDRLTLVKRNNLCVNCLCNHSSRSCSSLKRCQICVGKHHTSLHLPFERVSRDEESHSRDKAPVSGSCENKPSSTLSGDKNVHNTQIGRSLLLATAIVDLELPSNYRVPVRALIDPCSETSLIEEGLVQRLRLSRKRFSVPLAGVDSMNSRTRGLVSLTISSRLDNKIQYSFDALILNRLSSYAPHVTRCPKSWPHFENIDLADPELTAGRPVELLLGAEIYSMIIRSGLKRGIPGSPVAQATTLGWIITGPPDETEGELTAPPRNVLHCSIEDDICNLLQKFWRMEEVAPPSNDLTDDESACESFFVKTHSRDRSGRYTVRLPFRESLSSLGNSYASAAACFRKLERRFESSDEFYQRYRAFMSEYIALDHMEEATDTPSVPGVYYLPHHGVLRESSTTTKLRVVFNGSSRTSTGRSLNDLLLSGPNLLPEIPDILLRWRCHAKVFAADMEKMYRQIWVADNDRDAQRILWRGAPGEEISVYRLRTVTYGLACAPYLAMRTIRQLSDDEERQFPLAAPVLRGDVYMDDVLSGASTITEALELQHQLISMLRSGGFTLRKWTSNDPQLLSGLPQELVASEDGQALSINNVFSLLGLRWLPSEDCFLFKQKQMEIRSCVTKRQILREVASIFDPLGFLAPVIVAAKIFLQELWLLKVGWDEPLPPQHTEFWTAYCQSLCAISSIRVPRWFGTIGEQSLEIHGFSDASEKAYAGVVYFRVKQANSSPLVTFVTAKTRVAPLQQVSLPRLELCAAVLLSRLVHRVVRAINRSDISIHLWTDSTIVIHWLQGRPSKWKTFVANRVSEIQTLFPNIIWHHINSKQNPADQASRGIYGSLLNDNPLWWSGPSLLASADINYENYKVAYCDTDEEKRREKQILATSMIQIEPDDLLLRYSSFNRLIRITAWCVRWLRRYRKERKESSLVLNTEELRQATLILIRVEQRRSFSSEISALNSARLPLRGPLGNLTPFLDEQGLLRVGGRLKHSLLDYDEKHPIILAERSPLTKLIIVDHHERLLHGGTQLTLSLLRRAYWIPRGRRVVRAYLHKCVKCWRWRARAAEQIMGDLPPSRVTPARPFLNSGIDYAGPFVTKLYSGRCNRTSKSYVAVFVCMATRAVHLELVSDYTCDAFLAAFRRFVSRRGLCASLRSDCGTNFVGADRELRRMLAAASSERATIARALANMGTQWIFNPPAAPHFGGLWEAAVKSVKYHLRRVIGDTLLTFEEMLTLLTQIEACLNSRPLSPLTDESTDSAALTPAHFLIGTTLAAIPEPTLLDTNTARLTRWQSLQKMRDHFWERWSNEYLQALQRRTKWRKPEVNVKPGDLCLVLHERTPPTRWPLGRVEEVHAGPDGRVRVVTVRTAYSVLTRPIAKLCLFPSDNECDSE